MQPPRRNRRLELGAVAVTNLLPLAGVTVLGWSLAAVVLLYWLELGVLLWWSAVRATFAQRPSVQPADALLVGATRHKRGGLSVPRTGLSVRVQHLPVVAVAAPVLGLLWVFVGGATVAALEQTAAASALARDGTYATVALGTVGIFGSQGASTVSEFFLDGRYEEVNAQQALQTATWPLAVVGTAMMFAVAALSAGGSGLLLVGALVCVKLLFDVAGVYRDRLRAFDERTAVEFGWANDPPERSPVDDTLSGPVRTVRPRRLGVLASGVVRGLTRELFLVLVAVPAVATVGFLAAGIWPVARFFGAIAGALVVAFLAAGVFDTTVRHRWMEYRVSGDVVGYDRLLGESQWRVPEWKVARADPERTVVDRLLGTETLVVEDGDRTVRLVHVRQGALAEPDGEPEEPRERH